MNKRIYDRLEEGGRQAIDLDFNEIMRQVERSIFMLTYSNINTILAHRWLTCSTYLCAGSHLFIKQMVSLYMDLN